MIGWLRETPAGRAALGDFQTRFWQPMRAAAASGDDARLLRMTVSFFSGSDVGANIPADLQSLLIVNVPEFRALASSADPFPAVDREAVRRLRKPVLLISGERTYRGAQLIDAQLMDVLLDPRRVIVADADHNMCTEKPAFCASAISDFLSHARM